MRILQLVINSGSIGGIEIFVHRLSSLMLQQGHCTTLVAGDVPSSSFPCEVIAVPELTSTNTGEDMAVLEQKVMDVAAAFRPDAVLTHTVPHPGLLRRLNNLYPTVEFIHTFLCGGGKLFRRTDKICTHAVGARCLLDWYVGRCGFDRSPAVALRIHQRTVRHIDVLKELPAVLVASDYMREYLQNEGLAPDRIFLAEYVTGIPEQKEVTRRQRAKENILFVGRVTYNKGVQHVLTALKHLDESFHVTVVGDGYYLETLKGLGAQLGVEDRVEFTGFLKGADLEAKYHEATIAVVPSIWPEPAGFVVPEARGRGLPVVAFNVGGIGEWATRYGYDNVYLAESVDAPSLAEALHRAAQGEASGKECPPATPQEAVVDVLERVVKGRSAQKAQRTP